METLADERQVMLVERLDRERLPHGVGRHHMVSALTLLALHEQDSPDASYAAISDAMGRRSEEHTSELQSLMRLSYDVFCVKHQILIKEKVHYHKEIQHR